MKAIKGVLSVFVVLLLSCSVMAQDTEDMAGGERLFDYPEVPDTIITLEDGCLAGGFGEKIARFYGEKGLKTYCFGADKEFTNLVPLKELYHRYELTPEQIIQKVL